jgi:hypothetical protein
VEAFSLAVGLRPVGPGALGRDAQCGAGAGPVAAAVAAAVVGEHPAGGHAAGGEPGARPAQHAGGGRAGLVVADLGVGHPAVVIEHDVDEGMSHQRVAMAAAGSPAIGGAVGLALLMAEEAPATTGGDVAQLLHIGVQQLTGGGVLVADRRLVAALVNRSGFSGGSVLPGCPR